MRWERRALSVQTVQTLHAEKDFAQSNVRERRALSVQTVQTLHAEKDFAQSNVSNTLTRIFSWP
jgi:uncharacterized protein YqfA (UPF0365 family)